MRINWGMPFVILTLCVGLFAQGNTPTLTDVQKLQIQNLSQQIEIAQLKAQLAQREFETARSELSRLVQTLTREGFTLDLSTLSYRPEARPGLVPDAAPAPSAPTP